MSNSIQRSYYEDDIQNATPQRLRLMLIEGAIRFARKSVSLWETDREAALTALGRCRNIVIELIASIRGDRDSCEYIVDHIVRSGTPSAAARQAELENLESISRTAMAIYLIVYRQLDEAQLSGESDKICIAIEILDVERETARLVCESLPEAPALKAPREGANITSSDAAALLTKEKNASAASTGPATYDSGSTQSISSMSFEA